MDKMGYLVILLIYLEIVLIYLVILLIQLLIFFKKIYKRLPLCYSVPKTQECSFFKIGRLECSPSDVCCSFCYYLHDLDLLINKVSNNANSKRT